MGLGVWQGAVAGAVAGEHCPSLNPALSVVVASVAGGTVRVVGYVRESADPSAGDSAFSQQEAIRRHALEHGYAIVAVCLDARVPGEALGRDGYLGLLGVIASGATDAVVVPSLSVLSSDQIVQEIMLWDLRSRGVRVLSADPADITLLDAEEGPGPSRMLIRDVLQRVGEHARSIGAHRIDPPGILADGDVMIHIIEADAAEAAASTS